MLVCKRLLNEDMRLVLLYTRLWYLYHSQRTSHHYSIIPSHHHTIIPSHHHIITPTIRPTIQPSGYIYNSLLNWYHKAFQNVYFRIFCCYIHIYFVLSTSYLNIYIFIFNISIFIFDTTVFYCLKYTENILFRDAWNMDIS